MRRSGSFNPLSSSARRPIVAILCTFALSSSLTVGLSIWWTSRSQHRAAVFQIAARQRTLAERYLGELLIARAGGRADPRTLASVLRRSAAALLDGGEAPAVSGDDDGRVVGAQRDPVARGQLEQAQRLVRDLTTAGEAFRVGRPLDRLRPTGGERLPRDPLARLRVLTALTSNVSLNAARTIANAGDRNISDLISLQVALGIGGLLLSLLLALALLRAVHRRTALFRSLVRSSTDLVIVFGEGGCRYVSDSVRALTGQTEQELLADGIFARVDGPEREAVRAASLAGEPAELVFGLLDRFGDWRQLEAHVSDLRDDGHVRGVVFNARDVTERLELERELVRQAFHDSLTALPNRALFRDRLEHALARGRRAGETLAVLLIDLDGFKHVNDSLGHDAGDVLLQEVSRRFASVVRASDTVARLGGDEFALLLEDAGEHQVVLTAERLIAAVREPIAVEGRELVLGASVGIRTASGGSASSDALMRDADIAMYAAKARGRGGYELFEPEMAREVGELLEIEHELRRALVEGEFSLEYQPLVDVASGGVVGVEALLRWTSPRLGRVPPSRFIPIAERTGLIVELGELVLREACRQAAQWLAELGPERTPTTWVNVSAKQLSAGGFEHAERRALEAAGLPPSLLGIEITETALVEPGAGAETARAELEALHRDGVRIAIDDFGTGFSSLGQLRHFAIDVIKVDRSFVSGTPTAGKDATITSSLISLAHALDVVAVAEGIESVEQLDAVRGFGCDHAQGYLFSRPATAQEIGELLRRGRIEPELDAEAA